MVSKSKTPIDVKLEILFLLDFINIPLTVDQTVRLADGMEWPGYLEINILMEELCDQGLLKSNATIVNDVEYSLTKSGVTTSEHFHRRIPPSRRRLITQNCEKYRLQIIGERSCSTSIDEKSENEYIARLKIIESNVVLIDLAMNVPTNDAAQTIVNNFEKYSSAIYTLLMDMLLEGQLK